MHDVKPAGRAKRGTTDRKGQRKREKQKTREGDGKGLRMRMGRREGDGRLRVRGGRLSQDSEWEAKLINLHSLYGRTLGW